MKLVLYYAPYTCALVPYVALTEAGAEFDVRAVNLLKREHLTQEYSHLNPKHKVPVLLIDHEVLTENVAIQIWIARQFPDARLLPAEGFQEIKAISLLAWCASAIHPSLTPNVLPQRYCDLPGSEESVKRCACKRLLEEFHVAEDLLRNREWFFDDFTVADAYFFWCFRRSTQLNVDLSAFKHCRAHFDRMLQRWSVQKLVKYEKQVLEHLSSS